MSAFQKVSSLIALTMTALAISAQVSQTPSADRTQPLIIGVLEDVPGHYVGQPHVRAVRVVFRKAASEWQPFPSDCANPGCLTSIASKYPSEVTWTVTFDGRALGTVTSHARKEFATYSDVGLESIADGKNVPIIGKRSTEFGGYRGEPVYRPLVTSSQGNYRDPDMWKPTQLRSSLITAIRHQFRRRFPVGSRCDQDDPTDERSLTYVDADIKVAKAYSSQNGWYIAKVQLVRFQCSGEIEHDFADQWFVVDSKQQTKFISEGIQLIDAGDYDNDGHSELIFLISRENRGGYELYYDHFSKRAVFEFSYH